MSTSTSSDEDNMTLAEMARANSKQVESTSKTVTPVTVNNTITEAKFAIQLTNHVAATTSTTMPLQRSGSRSRERQEKVGELTFDNLHDCKMYFICDKHKDFSSPCVPKENLVPEYPIVYEQWQVCNPQDKDKQGKKLWYHCRRQRKYRLKKGARRSQDLIRKPKLKKEKIGCDCKARYCSIIQPDGRVRVEFFGKHNHCCQSSFAMNFLNPIRTCEHIREIVDSKLLAGVQQTQQILKSVVEGTIIKRTSQHTTFNMLRAHNMGIACKAHQIRNRREQLGLNTDTRLHK